MQEADGLSRGELGGLLRREGLYTSQISDGRKQREHALRKWMEPHRPGPKPAPANPLSERVAELERENAALQRRVKQAEMTIEVQRKISEILSIPLNPPDSDKNG